MSDWMCTRRRSAWHWPREKRSGEVRQVGVFQNRPEIVCKMAAKLGRGGRRLSSCYDAGPCDYGLHRLLTACGHSCVVVAPSLISMKSGDRVKTDRREAMMLAKLHRAGELTIGDGAYVTAGSVITRDVEPGALSIARGQQVDKPGRAAEIRARLRRKV
jgi:hypothetical protein